MLDLAGSATDRRCEPRSNGRMAPREREGDQSEGMWADGVVLGWYRYPMGPLAICDRMSRTRWILDTPLFGFETPWRTIRYRGNDIEA